MKILNIENHTRKAVLETASRVINIESKTLTALENSLKSEMAEPFADAVELIINCRGRVITTGMGKSGIIATKISSTLASTGTPSFFIHPAEALHGDLGRIRQPDVLLALSNSGETEEILKIVPFLKNVGSRIISITGKKQSPLASLSDIPLIININGEACPLNLAPSASTTAALALGDALALSVCTARGFQPEDFANLHPAGTLGRKLFCRIKDVMHTDDEVPVIDKTVPLKDAVQIMSDKGFGCIFVLEDAQLYGVLTDGDLRRIIGQDISRLQLSCGELCKVNPKYISPDAFIGEAIEEMEKFQITTLAVKNNENLLIGIVHLHDLLGRGDVRITS